MPPHQTEPAVFNQDRGYDVLTELRRIVSRTGCLAYLLTDEDYEFCHEMGIDLSGN